MPKLLIVLLLIFMNFSADSSAGEQLTVVTDHAPPYHFLNQQGEIVGSTTRLVREILDETALDYQLAIYPWVRAYKMALNRPNVLIYTIIRDPSREASFHWFCPISRSEPMFLYKLASNSHNNPRSLEELDKSVIGVIKDDFRHQQLLKRGFKTNQQLDESAYAKVNVKKLLMKRVEFIISTEREITNLLKGFGEPLSTVQQSLFIDEFEDQQLCMALSKNSPEHVRKKLHQAFERVQQRPRPSD